jgi:hypothetical protein
MTKYLTWLVGLAAASSELILGLYFFCPSEAQWQQIDMRCATMSSFCDSDLIPGSMWRGTSFNVWIHQPATVRAALVAFIATVLLTAYLAARWHNRGSN